MISPVLATKLYPPPLRADRVERPRLIKQLRENNSRKLTLVSAPAGFGKTTLIREWLEEQNTPFVWYQLDEADSDPARFMTHLMSGMSQQVSDLDIEIEGLFQGQGLPSPSSVFTEFINVISTIQGRIVIVLDDYHRLDSPYLDEGISFLLEHQPPELHLVIITREDPDLPLSRLRGRGMLTEIRANNLRFTADEIAIFLRQTMGLSLDQSAIDQLNQRTEGWIAGLQLAGLSLVGRGDTSSIIDNFRGDDRYVVDYLMTEVLNQQSDELQDFLLKTSILETLSSGICNHLLGRDDSDRILSKIDSANLFLVPLDNRRQTYRYHHLFADLLQHQLKLRYDEGMIQGLHRGASDWYHEQGDALSSIHHALHANDYVLAADLTSHYRLKFLKTGEWFTMGRLLRQLPPYFLESYPDLALARAWEMLASAKMSDLVDYLDKLASRLSDPHLISEAAILQGYIMLWRNQPQAAIEHSQRALHTLELDNDFLHSFALNNLGFAYRAANRLDEALEVFQEVERLYGETQSLIHVRMTVNALADIHIMRGDFVQAKQVFQSALDRYSDRGHPPRMMGLLYLGLGNIYYEWNQLDLAEHYISRAISGWSETDRVKEVINGHLSIAFVYQAQGKVEEAQQSMRIAVDMLNLLVDDALKIYFTAYQARLDLLQGRWTAVEAWANSLPLDIENPAINDFTQYSYLTLIRWWLKDNKSETLQQVQTILHSMIELADKTGRSALKAEALLLHAMLAQTFGESSLATDYLVNSLREGHQFKRLYITEGESIRSLLETIAKHKNLPTALSQHVNDLLSAISTTPPNASVSSLVEPLTERELDVLHQLAQGKSNQQIAKILFVSVGTVKTHARHIYEKLEVNNRTHAVARARELGLLD